MPKYTKNEMYKKEQDDVIQQLITILNLDTDQNSLNTYTLYEWDNDAEMQEKIINLTPEIKKWFPVNAFKAITAPQRIKRAWLSIIKQLTKNHYEIKSKDYQCTIHGHKIRTQIYTFIPKQILSNNCLNA